MMPAIRCAGVLFLLLTTGCVGVERAPPPTGAPSAEPVADEPSPAESIVKTEIPEYQAPGTLSPSPAPAEPPRKKPAPAPATGKPESPPLDLTALETRLKETRAIGVFTKITLKNQVDDLLNQFRAFYQGKVKTTLPELRQPYDRLLLKVLALLQDGDPDLARAIVASREAIWSILSDPAKFATL